MHSLLKTLAALVFAAVLTSAPTAPGWASESGACDRAKGGKAIAACTRLIESGRLSTENLAIAYNNRGIAYRHKEQYDQAIADSSKALELKPDFAPAYANRGEAYRRKRQYDRAIADFTKAIELNPDDATAYYGRSRAYKKKGREDLAFADSRKADTLMEWWDVPILVVYLLVIVFIYGFLVRGIFGALKGHPERVRFSREWLLDEGLALMLLIPGFLGLVYVTYLLAEPYLAGVF